jgi:protein-disulfide isomerase
VGNPLAPVELVLFEDLRCGTCRDFDTEITPKLKSRYIDKGQVRYTVVLLSFLEGSKPLANAALAVYQLAPQQFLPFVHQIFQKFLHTPMEGSEKETLLAIATQLGGIDLVELEKCIDMRCHYETLDQNFFWAKKLMGNDLRTPALYVDGVATPVLPFRAIQAQIERALQKQRKK